MDRSEILASALEPRWDVIVVDEAHYLAESGTPRNPYLTARARLGPKLRDHSKSLILLSATPHNGYPAHARAACIREEGAATWPDRLSLGTRN